MSACSHQPRRPLSMAAMSIWCRHRCEFMASQEWMLRDPCFSVLQRIWFLYLFWVCYFVGKVLKLYWGDIQKIAVTTSCRIADAFLGGNRTIGLQEARRRRLADLKVKNALIKAIHRQQNEECFQLRLQREAKQNPHFIAPNNKDRQ